MILITGDVHHGNLPNKEHKLGFSKEYKYAKEYLTILKEHNLKSTLFLCGKELETRPDFWKKIIKNFSVEIGGHTYAAWGNYILGQGFIFKKLFGCFYGPAFFQKRDIDKCFQIFEKQNLKLISWRTHEYQSNKQTLKLLKKRQIRVVSDKVDPNRILVYDFYRKMNKPIVQLPINILPDHENVNHGYSQDRLPKNEYKQIILKQLKYLDNQNSLKVLLLHPVCMKVLDNFDMFTQLCETFKKYKSMKICELVT